MKNHTDISDDDIRIIRSNSPQRPKRKGFVRLTLIIAAAVVAAAAAFFAIWSGYDADADDDTEVAVKPMVDEEAQAAAHAIIKPNEPVEEERGMVVAVDTVIDGKGLKIYWPKNLRPRLVIGIDKLNDAAIALATQAADIRRDNGQIAGTFVLEGELLSKGEAKAGFCSIIDDEITIGTADATPMLEQALTHGGFFFRQYPLVVGGQLVENKPKGKAVRKALAELDGKICVVMSKGKLTFHDFSQALIDMGVRNAIYLVGSSSHGFYVDDRGDRVPTGAEPQEERCNVSYIVWEQS